MRSGLILELVTTLLLIIGQQIQGAGQQSNNSAAQTTITGSSTKVSFMKYSLIINYGKCVCVCVCWWVVCGVCVCVCDK